MCRLEIKERQEGQQVLERQAGVSRHGALALAKGARWEPLLTSGPQASLKGWSTAVTPEDRGPRVGAEDRLAQLWQNVTLKPAA